MIIVKATANDLKRIMEIVNQAKEYLKSQKVNQWQDGYPNEEAFLNDIKENRLYVVKDNEIVIGVFAVVNYEETYKQIYEGQWLSNGEYIAVHRVAIDNDYKGKGVAKFIFDTLKKDHNDIRVDTHEANYNMNKCLINNNFKRCGIIYLARTESDCKRIAYEYLNKEAN